MATRKENLLPGGTPKYIRVYDNQGESADRYTCVFTGRYKGGRIYLGMSSKPYHPMGISMHGFSDDAIDRPKYAHLGKKVSFDTLPEEVKTCIMSTYKDIWNL